MAAAREGVVQISTTFVAQVVLEVLFEPRDPGIAFHDRSPGLARAVRRNLSRNVARNSSGASAIRLRRSTNTSRSGILHPLAASSSAFDNEGPPTPLSAMRRMVEAARTPAGDSMPSLMLSLLAPGFSMMRPRADSISALMSTEVALVALRLHRHGPSGGARRRDEPPPR